MMPAYFYTVFGRRFEPAIRCAIAQSKPIPEFIQAADWEFVGTVRPSESPPVGFRHARAEEATRFVGFFVFHSETVACREQPETGSALHAPHARHLGAMPAQHGHTYDRQEKSAFRGR